MFIQKRPENYYDNFCIKEMLSSDEDLNIKIPEAETILANNLFNLLQDLVDEEERLNEDFTSIYNSKNHFNKHCLNNNKKKSTRTNVYYDFNTLQDYLDYENLINNKTKSNNRIFIDDILLDVPGTLKAFRKLFEGNVCLVFGLSSGFTNSLGQVRLCFRSYSTNVTSNYINNTVDFLIQAPNGDTVTLYPLDANYIENKINNEISKIPSNVILKINH